MLLTLTRLRRPSERVQPNGARTIRFGFRIEWIETALKEPEAVENILPPDVELLGRGWVLDHNPCPLRSHSRQGSSMDLNSAVSISFDDFVIAVSQIAKISRPPRGSVIPTDTLLSSHQDGILVETPVVSSLVLADKPWQNNTAVDARKLVEVCKTLRTLGAAGKSIQVRVSDRHLHLKFLTTTISLPTI
jgi:hypothetical protein